MSIKKPIISITRECSKCRGNGFISKGTGPIYPPIICPRCVGIGKIDVKKNNKDFKKYYIKNLEEVIEYWTRLYREKNKEAQDYLKKAKMYCKELDKVVNG